MELFIDTSDREKTIVALKKDDQEVLRLDRASENHRNQAVLLLVQEALQKQNITVKDLTAISVNPGPGSFTGVRVGVSIANALGFALQIPVNGKRELVEPVYS